MRCSDRQRVQVTTCYLFVSVKRALHHRTETILKQRKDSVIVNFKNTDQSPKAHLNATAAFISEHSDKNVLKHQRGDLMTHLLGFGLFCRRSIFI